MLKLHMFLVNIVEWYIVCFYQNSQTKSYIDIFYLFQCSVVEFCVYYPKVHLEV